ncbi:60S acidic ribosomal protein P2 [Oncorhynchus kisutch]|uniref:Large ribosomal subunit protein P2 n=3 Tax=Salmoninae TaxID=504568 RepID=A0A8C7GVW1_ONCKI|nr:60S acidic ribosomal protein P2-like [Oncorhynchus kisutch]
MRFFVSPLPWNFLSACANLAVNTHLCLFRVKMRYVAAYLLSALGGNASPQAADIKKILESVGIEADKTRMEKVVTELGGKNVEEVIAQGYGKLASMPAGGAVAVASSGGAAAAGAAAPTAAEEKKEEKEESEEGSDDDMGFGLFD